MTGLDDDDGGAGGSDTVSGEMPCPASVTGLLVLEAVVAFFLLPRAAASLGSSTVSNAGQVKLQK